jgi:hypothetical protein
MNAFYVIAVALALAAMLGGVGLWWLISELSDGRSDE